MKHSNDSQSGVIGWNRRRFMQGSAIILARAALADAALISFSARALAGDDSSPIASLRPSQRLLLGGALYKDVDAYLAFAKVVRLGLRGSDSVAKFDEVILQPASSDDKLDDLGGAIRDGILIDCGFSSAANPTLVSLQQLLSPSIPRIGLGAIISRQVGVALNQPALNVPEARELLRLAGKIELLASVPKQVTDKYVRDNLALLGGDGGLAGMIASSVPALGVGTQQARDIEAALLRASRSVKDISDQINGFVHNGQGNAGAVAASALALSTAVEALGKATGMNNETVHKISKGVNVAGAALSGAMAGAALGPYGAIAGGVIGLLGGLFGGSDGPDPTLQAIAQLDARISRLQQEVQLGFAQINRDLAHLSQQMQAGFSALSIQIREFQDRVLSDVNIVIELIREKSATDLQDKMDAIVNRAHEYEFQFRRASVDKQPMSVQAGADLRRATIDLTNTMKTAARGFCGTAFTGPKTFDQYLQDFSLELEKLPVFERLRSVSRFGSGWLPPPPRLGPNGPVTVPAMSIAEYADKLVLRLRHDRYEIGKEKEFERNGAGIVYGLQKACFAALAGIEAAPEWQTISRSPELRFLLPKPDANCPPPVAPQDLWSVCLAAQNAASELADTGAARELLRTSLDFLKDRVAAHYLLTGQNSLPTMLYVRRQIAAALANDIAIVFCNPYMSAVDVFRRAVSTEISKASPSQASHSPYRIQTLASAQDRLRIGNALAMPFAKTATVRFTDATAQVAFVEQEIIKLFARTQIDPEAPANVSGPPYFLGAANFEAANFATRLPKVVLSMKLEGSPADPTLTGRLKAIQMRCFVLAVIERCAKARLDGLRSFDSSVAVPPFETWFEGFEEYGIVASHALAQQGKPVPPGVDPEFEIAHVVLQSMLGGPPTFVPFPDVPAGLPDAAKPYPSGIGQLWGWGAERMRAADAATPELIAALLRPECAFAGENGAIMGCVETISEMQALLQMMGAQSNLVAMIDRDSPEGLRGHLRNALKGT